jgi:tetratricopeptide (TPR) repeat protein
VPGLPDDLRAQILDRAEGVPLYAVETVRMLLDRGLLARDGDVYRPTGPIEALDVPETLHALVAARLDGLAPDERSVLQDAAVLGKSFTKPGLAALSGLDDAPLEQLLVSLVRKEVLSVQADPRSPERGQYSFVQDLLKRIAYDTLSKPERKARHIAAAAHLERTVAATEAELVEVIAAHYLDAYEAAPDADDAAALRTKAGEHLALAGERAASLAANEEAQRYFEKAATLTDDRLAGARLLERAGEAAQHAARFAESAELLRRAVALYNAGGATHAAARATAVLGLSTWREGDIVSAVEQLAEALAVLADDEPDAEIAALVEMYARLTYFLGEHDLASERVERALEIAEALPAKQVLADALNTKSLLLNSSGRYEESSALLARAVELGRKHEMGHTLLRAINNSCVMLSTANRFAELQALADEGVATADRLGHREHEQQLLSFVVWAAWMLGDWAVCDSLVERFTSPSPYALLFRANTVTFLGANRGRVDDCRRALATLESFKASDDAQIASGILRLEGLVLHVEGRYAEAAGKHRESVDADARVHKGIDPFGWAFELHALAEACDADLLEERLAVRDTLSAVERTPYAEATYARFHGRLLALRGDSDGAVDELEAAAEKFANEGMAFFEAATRVELAEAGGPPVPAEARGTLERLDAIPWLARADDAQRAVTV